jgi:glycosyltransferase involved in cell wall biosynthesis
MSFPPNLSNIRHVVINSDAQEQLALRTGISSVIIPNVLDFENQPKISRRRTKIFRESIGLEPEDRMILQPTRIIQRKGIEWAIDLVKGLRNDRNKLVISHEAGDEGMEYAEWIKDYACEFGVDLRLVSLKISDPLSKNGRGRGKYSLWDVYPYADFITFPSIYEGFDIEPLGFDLSVMDGFLSKKTVNNIMEILESSKRRKAMVINNYQIATRHYSYSVLRNQLTAILKGFFGDSVGVLSTKAPGSKPEGNLYINPQVMMYKHDDSDACSDQGLSLQH